jgi:hypothetical protein
VRLPSDWQSLFGDRGGRARFSRRFNRPTGLEPGDRIDLVLEGWGGSAEIVLNGEPLGTFDATDGETRIGITELLAAHNRVSILLDFAPVQASGAPGGLFRPVAIEILPRGSQAAERSC